MRLNLLRVPSFLAVNAATSSTGGTCGLPATARYGTDSPKPTPCLSPSPTPHSSLFLSGTSSVIQFFSGNAAAAAVDIDLGCGKGYIYPSPHSFPTSSPFPTIPPSLPSSPLRKSNPFIYFKFCRHFALIYILADCFLGRKCGTAPALPCPALLLHALLCLALCVCAAVQHVKRLLQLQHLLENDSIAGGDCA